MPIRGEDEDTEGQQPSNQNVDDPNDDTDPNQQVEAESEDPNVPRVVEAQEDERLSDQAEDDHDEDRGERPERKRETAKERRQRAKEAKERDKLELQILRNTIAKQNERLDNLSKTQIVNSVTDLDAKIASAIAEFNQFETIEARAITAKNGEDAVKAKRLAEEARQRAWALDAQRQQLLQQQQAPKTPQIAPYADKAVNFLKDKPWYNPNATNESDLEDTLVAEAIDKALMKRMDPNTPQYWTELDKRVKERLPHRFESKQDDYSDDDLDDEPQPRRQQASRKGPPTGGSSKNSSRNGGPREISIPAEMVAAMKEAGHWDDPKRRARVAQRYIDGLKQNRNG
jgi:hypothetical protein